MTLRNPNLIKNANGTQNLMTKEIAKRLPAIGKQDGLGNAAIAYVKYFLASFTWYATEYNPETGEMFGKVFSHLCPEGELGYFYLHGEPEDALSKILVNGYQAIERDTSFEAAILDDCKNPCVA